jgi:hypothetical protein
MYGNNDPEHERFMEEHERDRVNFIHECERKRRAQPAPVSRDAQEAQFESWWESLASKWDGADAKNAAWQAWRAAAELGAAE